jgi:hypothetical protein
MNDETTNLDQADEEILTYTVSDEALEAAMMCRYWPFSLTQRPQEIPTTPVLLLSLSAAVL